MKSSDLIRCMEFLTEVEKLKMVYRQNVVIDGSRRENSAEHSWHIALMAVVLADCSDDKDLDWMRVTKMLLIHDIVEIDGGDTFLYDAEANKTKAQTELATARRVFGMLPETLGAEFLSLWLEFEDRSTPESKFAAALDSLQPLTNHLASKGQGIIRHKISTSQVIEKKKHIAEASKELWEFGKGIIQKSESMGIYLPPETAPSP